MVSDILATSMAKYRSRQAPYPEHLVAHCHLYGECLVWKPLWYWLLAWVIYKRKPGAAPCFLNESFYAILAALFLGQMPRALKT